MTRNKWRRTDLNGEIAPDDWTLLDPSGEPLARLYKVFGGPQDSRWYWTVLFRPDGSAGNGGNGFTATGREAREACETRIAETMRQTAERAGLKRSRNRFKQPLANDWKRMPNCRTKKESSRDVGRCVAPAEKRFD